jgi:hypothetical protein
MNSATTAAMIAVINSLSVKSTPNCSSAARAQHSRAGNADGAGTLATQRVREIEA